MLKKILSSLTAVVLALGGVALTAGPAQAAAPVADLEITSSISCTSDFTYEITWSVANSSGLPGAVTASTNTTVFAVGDSIPTGVTTRTQTVASAQTASLDLTVQLTGGSAVSASETVRANNFPNCSPPVAKVPVCHATPADTAANGWNTILVDDSSVIDSAHNNEHDADIIGSFTYWKQVSGVWTLLTYPGKNLTTVFGGLTGAQIAAAECSSTVNPAAPTFTPSVCTAPGVAGAASYTIPTTAGVTYRVQIGAGAVTTVAAGTYSASVPSTVTITAIATGEPTTLSGTTSWNYSFTSPGDCLVEVAPVAPTVTEITECGEYGSLVIPTTNGVVYELTDGDGTQGAWEVTATAAPGYVLTGQTVFSGDLGEYTDCATPQVPTYSDFECIDVGQYSDGYFTIPATDGVIYVVSIDGSTAVETASGMYFVFDFPTTVVVTAEAQSGYTIVGDAGPWTLSFTDPGACGALTPVTPAPPTFVQAICTGPGQSSDSTYTIPTTAGVTYLVSVDGSQAAVTAAGAFAVPDTAGSHTVVVSAEAAADYTLTGYTNPWSFVFSDVGDCLTEVEPASVSFADSECPGVDEEGIILGTVTIPSTAGVEYWVTVNGGTPTLLATGQHSFLDGDEVIVEARAATGFSLADVTTTWSHEFAVLPTCDAPTLAELLPAVAVTAAQCDAPGAITVTEAAHLLYFIDGTPVTQAVTAKAAGTYTVTAASDDPLNYTILDNEPFIVTVAAPTDCLELTTLALTGSGGAMWMAGSASLALVVVGGILLMVRRRDTAS